MTRRVSMLLALAAGVGIAACDSATKGGAVAPGSKAEPAPVAKSGVEAVGKAAVAPTPKTLPVLGTVPDFVLLDQDDHTFGPEDFRGHVWVLDFFFSTCPICDGMTAGLGRIQAEIPKNPDWDGLRFASISVDPEADTPTVLAKYADKHKVDGKTWRFLTGTRDAIWRLSKEGMKLPVGEAPAGADMPLFHSLNYILVDREGRIRGYYDSQTPEGPSDLRRDIGVVSAEPWAPIVEAPAGIVEVEWLEARQKAQLATAKDVRPFHDFGFTDRLVDSGITFLQRIVDDSGLHGKAVHYDHGNSIIVADVDGDGRLDIYFMNQLSRSELWRNKGGGLFEDITDRAGVAIEKPVGIGASFADIDNDGDPDLFVTTIRGGNLMFENDGRGKFTDITEKAGVGYTGHSSGALFFDYDRDGLVDLLVSNVGEYTTDEQGRGGYYVGHPDAFSGHLKPERSELSILYKNMGGNVFEDVTQKTGLVSDGWSGEASMFDGNGDGFLDVYMVNMQGRDDYFENVGGERFVNKTDEVFPSDPWGAMGVAIFDFNLDGLFDVFLTDMHTDMSPQQGMTPDHEKDKIPLGLMFPPPFLATGVRHVLGNAFYMNRGGSKYEEVSDAINAENYWPWGPSTGDLNADGYEDVFIASGMSFPFRYGINTLLLNDAGEKFVDTEFILGIEPRRDGRTARPWFEMNCGGADKGRWPCTDAHKGRISVWGSLSSRSAAIFDVDDDGDLDIITHEFNHFPQFFISDLSEKKKVSFLKVRLRGTKSNRDGLGAVVTVHAGKLKHAQRHDGKSGYLSQSSLPLYFGLGEAESVDRIDVTWPSGNKQTIKGPIAANAVVEIEEK